MPVQGGNAIDHDFAYAGMIADNQLENAISKLNKSDSVSLPFGYAVVSDGDDGAALPTDASTAADFIGIVKRELNRAVLDGDTQSDNRKRDVTIATVASIYTSPIVDVTKDDPVFMVIGNGTLPNANLGRFSNVAGTGLNTAVQIPNAKWTSTATADNLAKVSVVVGG